MSEKVDWSRRALKGALACGVDPADWIGRKNDYIDLVQKMALEEVLDLKGNEIVLDFGCGGGRISYWIAPKVNKVVGWEVTPEMIQLAEKNRKRENVEFRLYNGSDFPAVPSLFDLILSVGVLQYMEGEALRGTVSRLTGYLKSGGRFCLIEQASDNTRVNRPKVKEYLQAFRESGLECHRNYPIRQGRSWMLYLVQYGALPKKLFPKLARREIMACRGRKGFVSYYQDHLFVLGRKN